MMPAVRTELITDGSAWKSKDVANDPSWIAPLDGNDLDELDSAIKHVNAKGVPLLDIKAGDFPLKNLPAKLDAWVRELRDGRGFLLVRGLPVDRYPEEDIRKMYWGIGVHMGTPLSQNSYGDLLGDIWDEGLKVKVGEFKGSREYRGTGGLKFHTDRADIVGLLCLQPAIEGGLSCLLSSTTVYNEFLEHHPNYLPALYNGFVFTNSEEGGDGSRWRVPMYTVHDGIVSCRLQRNTVERGRAAGVHFTDEENGALEFLDELCARDDLRLDMDFQRGDIQFINNFTIMHSRTPYVDHDDREKKRHLLRIWLQLAERRPIGSYYGEYNGIPKTLTRNN